MELILITQHKSSTYSSQTRRRYPDQKANYENRLGPRERAKAKLEKIRKARRKKYLTYSFSSLILLFFGVSFLELRNIPSPLDPDPPLVPLESQNDNDDNKDSEPPLADSPESPPNSSPESPSDSSPESPLLETPTSEETLPESHLTKILTSFQCDNQHPSLPEGCEVTSLAAVLNYHNVTTDKLLLANQYLPVSSLNDPIRDPDVAYVGDPASIGWYCFEAPLISCANDYLADVDSTLTASKGNLTTMSDFIHSIDNNTPPILWLTTNYSAPFLASQYTWNSGDTTFHPYHNLHVVTLVGYCLEENLVYIADPLKPRGDLFVELDIDTFLDIYQAMGSRSVVVQ